MTTSAGPSLAGIACDIGAGLALLVGALCAHATWPQHQGYDPIQPQEYGPALTVLGLFVVAAAVLAVGGIVARLAARVRGES